MAGYRLLVKASAAKELEAVEPRKSRERLVRAIGSLGTAPRPHGCEKLAGATDVYRIRQGDYRVVYSIDDHNRIVRILKIGHRREIYR